jgi:hypothetical protein
MGNAKHGISPRLKIWTSDLDLWPWTSIGFQILLRTKYVPSLVKIHGRMLILECSQGCYGRTDGSVTISLHNFVGEGIIMTVLMVETDIITCMAASPIVIKPKTIKLVFVAKHAALRRKSKDWLTRNQNNVSEWSDMSTCRLLFQWASIIKIQLSVLVYYKADLVIISLKINWFPPLYSWKIAELALNNNHSLLVLFVQKQK